MTLDLNGFAMGVVPWLACEEEARVQLPHVVFVLLRGVSGEILRVTLANTTADAGAA